MKIEIFDPAMCCSTGVCGPSVDPELIRVANEVEKMKKQGVDVQRFNLSQEPQAFVMNATVKGLLEEKGVEVLPVTLVNGEVKKEGAYPATKEWEEWTGLKIAKGLNILGKRGGCGCGGSENGDSCC